MARPSSLTPAVTEKVCRRLLGVSWEAAAAHAGVGPATVHRWLATPLTTRKAASFGSSRADDARAQLGRNPHGCHRFEGCAGRQCWRCSVAF